MKINKILLVFTLAICSFTFLGYSSNTSENLISVNTGGYNGDPTLEVVEIMFLEFKATNFPNDLYNPNNPLPPIDLDPQENDRHVIFEHAAADDCCAYVVKYWRRSFLGIDYGEIHIDVTVVGCIC